jgi:GcrA cell cycle regulator
LSVEPPRATSVSPGPDLIGGAQHGGEAASAAPRSAPVRPVLARTTRPAACCWPIGEPGTKDFHFCDGEAMPGKPYCAEHAQIAYVKVRDRREEAA